MKFIITTLALLISTLMFAQPAEEKALAIEKANKAQWHLNQNHLDSAIIWYDVAFRLDPNTIHYQYQKAFCYYLQEEYNYTIKIIRSLLLHEDADDAYFQLLGGAYRKKGNLDKANEVYRVGLLKYPNSGKLYMELGQIDFENGKEEKALEYWEKGMQLSPAYSSNYYWATKYLKDQDEKIWAIIYGEIFLNLEKNTIRSYEISKILFDTYRSALSIGDTSDIDLVNLIEGNLTDDILSDTVKPYNESFLEKVEKVMNIASVSLVGLPYDDILIRDLNTLRSNFVKIWIDQGYYKNYRNVWTDRIVSIYETGGLDAYNYWLFNQGNFNEFENWYDANEKYYTDFIGWFSGKELDIKKNNLVVRPTD